MKSTITITYYNIFEWETLQHKLKRTRTLLGPSTESDRPPPPSPLVMVKLHGSPLFPDDKPGPYAVTDPLNSVST